MLLIKREVYYNEFRIESDKGKRNKVHLRCNRTSAINDRAIGGLCCICLCQHQNIFLRLYQEIYNIRNIRNISMYRGIAKCHKNKAKPPQPGKGIADHRRSLLNRTAEFCEHSISNLCLKLSHAGQLHLRQSTAPVSFRQSFGVFTVQFRQTRVEQTRVQS